MSAEVRLEVMQLPEPVDRVLAHALGLGHQSATPVGHALGLGLQGGGNQRVALGQVILRFTTPTGLSLPDRVYRLPGLAPATVRRYGG